MDIYEAVYFRYENYETEYFTTFEEALEFLTSGNEVGDLYPVSIKIHDVPIWINFELN